MKSCGTCRDREGCVKICAQVEARLPKEYTGKDPRHEVSMDPSDFGSFVDGYSYSLWTGGVATHKRPDIDLSRLTTKERNALIMLAQGMSMRAAARRLKINLNALQSRVRSARRKFMAGQFADIAKGGGRPAKGTKGGVR